MYWTNKELKLLTIKKTARKTGVSLQKVLKVCIYSEQAVLNFESFKGKK